MFLAIRGDPERHDQAVLADVHAVDQQADQVERLERRGLPRRQLRRRLRHEAAAHRALARAPARARRPAPAPDCAHTGGSRRPPASARRRADSTDRPGPSPGRSAAGLRGPRRGPAAAATATFGRRAPLRCGPSPRARRGARADAHTAAHRGGAVLLQQRARTFRPERTASSKSSAFVSTRNSTSGSDGRGRFNNDGRTRLCETASWRLLCCEAFASGLVTTRVSRAVRSRRFNFQQLSGHPHVEASRSQPPRRDQRWSC